MQTLKYTTPDYSKVVGGINKQSELEYHIEQAKKQGATDIRITCPKCNTEVQETKTEGYTAECPECDEDFYSVELKTTNN